jgi:ABC-2 type transport system ATP-binding protein
MIAPNPQSAKPAVAVRGVRKVFHPPADLKQLLGLSLRAAPVVALDAVELTVARGETLGLMGSNGAGKSTLLRVVAGLLLPSAGTVTVCGLDAAAEARAVRGKIGYVAADDRGLLRRLSPREQLAFYGALYGRSRREALARADELLAVVGLKEHAERRIGELSTGLCRRVALATGLVGAPEVLILDEPTRGVDPGAAAALRDRFAAIAQQGCAVLLATHDAAEAERLCAKVAILEHGRVSAIEAPALAVRRLTGAAVA